MPKNKKAKTKGKKSKTQLQDQLKRTNRKTQISELQSTSFPKRTLDKRDTHDTAVIDMKTKEENKKNKWKGKNAVIVM